MMIPMSPILEADALAQGDQSSASSGLSANSVVFRQQPNPLLQGTFLHLTYINPFAFSFSAT